jgi:hypothetical protein
MTVTQLLERFTGIGIEQDQALLKRQYASSMACSSKWLPSKTNLKHAKATSVESCFPYTGIPMRRSD